MDLDLFPLGNSSGVICIRIPDFKKRLVKIARELETREAFVITLEPRLCRASDSDVLVKCDVA